MTKFLLASAAMLAVSTAALASEPQTLTEDQLSVVAGGFVDNGNNAHGFPSTLSFFLLNIETTEVTSTQNNLASSEQVGAAIGLVGPAVVFQHSTIGQGNSN